MLSEFQAMDMETERLLLNHLREHGLLGIAELEVRVRRGVAYIEGAVPNLKQKRLAGQIARQAEGIREIVNMLRITPLPVIDDDSLKKHISRALARNPRIDRTKLSIEVVNGVVYLGGFVSTAAEKRLAEHEVWATPGVKDIINKIDILLATPKSDIQIVGEILQSFADCLGLDLSKIAVELKDGTVHLRGTVPTEYLKEAAEELATWTPSVAGIVNELRVLEWPGSRGFSPLRLVRSPDGDCSGSNGVAVSGPPPMTHQATQTAEFRSRTNASKAAS